MRYVRLLALTRRHPSAILLFVQLLGLLLYPFLEATREGPVALGVFGIAVLIVTTRMVRDTPGLVGSSRVDLQACKLEYSIVSPK